MPLNVDVTQALTLLGHKTLELELLRSQCEQISEEFNKVQLENQELKKRIIELEGQPREVAAALREVK